VLSAAVFQPVKVNPVLVISVLAAIVEAVPATIARFALDPVPPFALKETANGSAVHFA
jgi:hypothetical protein